MAQICLRRTKEVGRPNKCPSLLELIVSQMQDADGNPLISLPPVEMTVVRVALYPDARVCSVTIMGDTSILIAFCRICTIPSSKCHESASNAL